MAAVTRGADERGGCLASYRVEVSSSAWAMLALAAILTTVGGAMVCTSFVSRGVLQHGTELTAIASACTVIGPLLAIIGMRGLLATDEYLAALENGLLVYVS